MDQNPGLRDFFESGFYEEYWPEADDESSVKELARKVLSLLGANSGHILDWRCGSGRYAVWFARAGLKVTLLDFMGETEEIKAFRSLNQALRPGAKLLLDCRKGSGSGDFEGTPIDFDSTKIVLLARK